MNTELESFSFSFFTECREADVLNPRIGDAPGAAPRTDNQRGPPRNPTRLLDVGRRRNGNPIPHHVQDRRPSDTTRRLIRTRNPDLPGRGRHLHLVAAQGASIAHRKKTQSSNLCGEQLNQRRICGLLKKADSPRRAKKTWKDPGRKKGKGNLTQGPKPLPIMTHDAGQDLHQLTGLALNLGRAKDPWKI